jgi:hypothetical protein
MSQSRVLVGLAMIALIFAGCASQAGPTATTTTIVPAVDGQQVVIAAPVRGEVTHSVTGRVTNIDREDSELTVKTPDGSKVKIKLPDFALSTVREGDQVSMNVTIRPQP